MHNAGSLRGTIALESRVSRCGHPPPKWEHFLVAFPPPLLLCVPHNVIITFGLVIRAADDDDATPWWVAWQKLHLLLK